MTDRRGVATDCETLESGVVGKILHSPVDRQLTATVELRTRPWSSAGSPGRWAGKPKRLAMYRDANRRRLAFLGPIEEAPAQAHL